MQKEFGPSLTALRLYRKKSAKGATYFSGRWGMLKVALLKSKEVADDGTEIWNLVFSAAPDKPATAGKADKADRPFRPLDED